MQFGSNFPLMADNKIGYHSSSRCFYTGTKVNNSEILVCLVKNTGEVLFVTLHENDNFQQNVLDLRRVEKNRRNIQKSFSYLSQAIELLVVILKKYKNYFSKVTISATDNVSQKRLRRYFKDSSLRSNVSKAGYYSVNLSNDFNGNTALLITR